MEDALGSPTGALEIPGSNPGDPIFCTLRMSFVRRK